MRMPRFAYSFFSLVMLAVPLLTAVPLTIASVSRRAWDGFLFVIDTFVLATDPARLRDLFRIDGPALAYGGPSDTAVDAALATDQRHEAGLARLGTVRHIS